MCQRLLLVFPDAERSEFIKEELLERIVSPDVDIDIKCAKSESEAWDRLTAQRYDLIITHLQIAENSDMPLEENAQLGLDLLKRIKEKEMQIPGILVSPVLEAHVLEAVNLLPQSRMLSDGSATWQDQIVELTKEALHIGTQQTGAAVIDKKVKLDFYVDLDREKWEMVSRGVGILCDETPRVLSVNTKKIRKLLKAGRRIEKLKGDWPDWEEEFQLIGELLLEQIFHKNPKVHNYFSKLSERVGGNENFSIRFNVGKEINPLILEAVMEPDYQKDDEYWMLKAPICRRIDVPEISCMPLFENGNGNGAERINCLIIESNVEGYIDSIDKELGALSNVPMETANLKEELENNEKEYNIGIIKTIPNSQCTIDKVEEILKGGLRWDMVHYAGHSYFDRDSDTGYLFFPGNDEIDKISIDRVSMWLREAKTRFIYLSSCHSSNEDFVYNLAKRGIPATVGYRWDIDDDKAFDHSRIFYENLFRERSLETAFLRTRQDLRERFKEHIVWAAPVLVMQVRN